MLKYGKSDKEEKTKHLRNFNYLTPLVPLTLVKTLEFINKLYLLAFFKSNLHISVNVNEKNNQI